MAESNTIAKFTRHHQMPRSKTPPDTPSFENAVAELEVLVKSLETGQLPLEESLDAYRRGVELLQCCQNQLKDAEEKVRILDQGQLRPLEGGAKDSGELL
jgi:exodeoxyribonuclease VII small subunit